MNDNFKCADGNCHWKKNYAGNITHIFGIFHRGKIYCLNCAVRLRLFKIKTVKPEILPNI